MQGEGREDGTAVREEGRVKGKQEGRNEVMSSLCKNLSGCQMCAEMNDKEGREKRLAEITVKSICLFVLLPVCLYVCEFVSCV